MMAYMIWSCVSVKSEAESYLIKKRDKEVACQEGRDMKRAAHRGDYCGHLS